jgi:hypothetical protein
MKRLEQRPRDLILRNAMRLLRAKYRGRPAWALVQDITGFGCTYSMEVCRELGINPCNPFKEFPVKGYAGRVVLCEFNEE